MKLSRRTMRIVLSKNDARNHCAVMWITTCCVLPLASRRLFGYYVPGSGTDIKDVILGWRTRHYIEIAEKCSYGRRFFLLSHLTKKRRKPAGKMSATKSRPVGKKRRLSRRKGGGRRGGRGKEERRGFDLSESETIARRGRQRQRSEC